VLDDRNGNRPNEDVVNGRQPDRDEARARAGVLTGAALAVLAAAQSSDATSAPISKQCSFSSPREAIGPFKRHPWQPARQWPARPHRLARAQKGRAVEPVDSFVVDVGSISGRHPPCAAPPATERWATDGPGSNEGRGRRSCVSPLPSNPPSWPRPGSLGEGPAEVRAVRCGDLERPGNVRRSPRRRERPALVAAPRAATPSIVKPGPWGLGTRWCDGRR